jgi:hypothetical protein
VEPSFPPSLLELQRDLSALIRFPKGAAQALQTLNLPALAWIAETPDLARGARLAIYAEAYFIRLARNLKQLYPRLAAGLGEDTFMRLAAHYYHVCPSDRPFIQESGRHLPTFLASWSESPEWALELAELEWQAFELLHAPADPLPPADPQLAQLRLASGACLRSTNWSWSQVWIQTQSEPQAGGQHVLLARSPEGVSLTHLDGLSADVFAQLQAGCSLAEVLEDEGLQARLEPLWLQNFCQHWHSQAVLVFA